MRIGLQRALVPCTVYEPPALAKSRRATAALIHTNYMPISRPRHHSLDHTRIAMITLMGEGWLTGGPRHSSNPNTSPSDGSSNPQTTSTNLSAAYSGLNSLPSPTPAQNSLLRSVLTVPGWYATATARSRLRARRCTSKLLVRLLTAALLARYVYHPLRRLSDVEPTRADMFSHVACWGRRVAVSPSSLCSLLLLPLAAGAGGCGGSSSMAVVRLGRNSPKCLKRSSGPSVLTRKTSRLRSASTCRGCLSAGWTGRIPGMAHARRR